MSSAASASASAARSKRASRAGSAPRRKTGPVAGAGARVRWDRLGRTAMLCVSAALVYLYLSAGIHMLSSWRQSRHDSAIVSTMRHEHALLLRQHETLSKQATLEDEARQLGMMKRGEQPYLVGSLPND
jgi:hypothetical protein